MKVTGVQTSVVNVPREHAAARPHLLVQIQTDDGVEGLGYTYDDLPIAPVKALVDELGVELRGLDPFRTEQALRRARERCADVIAGPVSLAMSVIDIALWDLKGKSAGQPLYRLLGGYRDKVPAYGSSAVMRNFSVPELADVARRDVERGFRAIKLRLGFGRSIKEEEARIKAVREAVGNDVDIMVDVNQAWTAHEAIRNGRMLEAHDVCWLEDPIHHQDMRGLAKIADALDMPICAGEYYWGKEPFVPLLELGAADIIMIDIRRVGGITEWMKLAGMAHAHNRMVVPHQFPEIHQHLIAAIPNGHSAQHTNTSAKLFPSALRLVDGCLVLPEKPGLGLELENDVVSKLRMQ